MILTLSTALASLHKKKAADMPDYSETDLTMGAWGTALFMLFIGAVLLFTILALLSS